MLLIAEGSCDCRRVGSAYAFLDPTSGVDVQDSCWKMFIYLPWVDPSMSFDLNPAAPDAVAATDTAMTAQLTSTTQTDIVSLSNTNCLAVSERVIKAAGFVDGGVPFSHFSGETPTGDVDYIGLIATNNFFFGIKGSGNLAAKGASGRMWGYRARADASTYAALVQSEVLSS